MVEVHFANFVFGVWLGKAAKCVREVVSQASRAFREVVFANNGLGLEEFAGLDLHLARNRSRPAGLMGLNQV